MASKDNEIVLKFGTSSSSVLLERCWFAHRTEQGSVYGIPLRDTSLPELGYCPCSHVEVVGKHTFKGNRTTVQACPEFCRQQTHAQERACAH